MVIVLIDLHYTYILMNLKLSIYQMFLFARKIEGAV